MLSVITNLTYDELKVISVTAGAGFRFTHRLSPDGNDRGNKFKTRSFNPSSNINDFARSLRAFFF